MSKKKQIGIPVPPDSEIGIASNQFIYILIAGY